MTSAETRTRRDAYRESYEAQRRAVDDPQFMALLWEKLAALNERYAEADG